MTLPYSGISLGKLKSEFGGNESPKLSDYYREGSFNTSFNDSVNKTGTISLGNFKGLSKPYTPKSNFVTITNNYIRGSTAGWSAPELTIEDGNITPGSVTLEKLANYLTGLPNSFQFRLIKVGNVIIPNGANSIYYDVKQGSIMLMQLALSYNGSMLAKPDTTYTGTGGLSTTADFTYVDTNGTIVVKTIKIHQNRSGY